MGRNYREDAQAAKASEREGGMGRNYREDAQVADRHKGFGREGGTRPRNYHQAADHHKAFRREEWRKSYTAVRI